MITNFKLPYLTLIAVSLAACSSSQDEVTPFSSTLVDETFNAFIADTTRDATVDDLSGVADMEGYYVMGYVENLFPDTRSEDIWGSAQVSADFGAGTVVGSVDDLGVYDYIDYDAEARVSELELLVDLDGGLDISGTIEGTGFTATITGDLTGTQEDIGNFAGNVDTSSSGEFYVLEDGRIAMNGDSEGTIEVTSDNAEDFSIDIVYGRLVVIE